MIIRGTYLAIMILVLGTSGCINGFTDSTDAYEQGVAAAQSTVFSISPSTATMTVQTSRAFTIVNGTAPYKYSILSDSSSGSIAATGTSSFKFTAGATTGSAVLQATDAQLHTAVATVVINGALQTAGAIQYVQTSTTTSIAVVAGGGVAPLTYSIDTTTYGTLNSSNGTFVAGATPNPAGTHSTVTITDSAVPPNVVTEQVIVYGPLTIAPSVLSAAGTKADSDPVTSQTSFKVLVTGGSPVGTPSFTYCTSLTSGTCAPASSSLTITSNDGNGLYGFTPISPAGTYFVCATDSQSNSACTTVISHSTSTTTKSGVTVYPMGSPATCTAVAPSTSSPVNITTANMISLKINDSYSSAQTYNLTSSNAGVTLNPTTLTSNLAANIQMSGAAFVVGASFNIVATDSTNSNQTVSIGVVVVASPSVAPAGYPNNVASGDTQVFALSGGVAPYCGPTNSTTNVALGNGVTTESYTFGAADTAATLNFYDSLGNTFSVAPANSSTFTGLLNTSASYTSVTAYYEMLASDTTQSHYVLTLSSPTSSPTYAPSGPVGTGSDYTYTQGTSCTPSCIGTDCSCTFSNLPAGVSFNASIKYNGVAPTGSPTLAATTTSFVVTAPAPGISVTSPASNSVTIQWQVMTVPAAVSSAGVSFNGYAIYYGSGSKTTIASMTALLNIKASDVSCTATKCTYAGSTPYYFDTTHLSSNSAYTFTVVPIVNGVTIVPSFSAGTSIQFPTVLVN